MNAGAIKTARVLAALEHRQGDRVPVGEFFWTSFVNRCKKELGTGRDFNPYAYWGLDLIVINPNMDPKVSGIMKLEETLQHTVVRTGFGSTVESRSDCVMPRYLDFETKTYEQMEAFRFDDPGDEKRYFQAIDDQINGVADALNLGLPSFVDRVNACADDFCVFGGVCEPHEFAWRIMGTDNLLIKLAEEPAKVAKFIERLGDFAVGIVEGQIAAGAGKLSGIYIWGDVAYDKGMFFSPDYWRQVYKPQLKRICDAAHVAGLKTIYHGCGNARAIFEDMIEVGVDCCNPLEAKAGLDVVELKRHYGKRWTFNGNIDVRVLATNDREKIRGEVLRKLNAAKGGGYILQSDHSVPYDVDPKTYDYIIQLHRKYGKYPLRLDEWDEDISTVKDGEDEKIRYGHQGQA